MLREGSGGLLAFEADWYHRKSAPWGSVPPPPGSVALGGSFNLSSVKAPVKPGRTVRAANTAVLNMRRALGQSFPRTLSFSPRYKVMNHFTDEETRALGGKVGDFPKVTRK